jgi:hypothetical protein
VDEVYISSNDDDPCIDFADTFRKIRPDILAVTTDDQYADKKKSLCDEVGATYVVLEKTQTICTPVSTSILINKIKAPTTLPLRIDMCGGWLDIPAYGIGSGGFLVNMTIVPHVSLDNWPYNQMSGLGGSAAWYMLNGMDVASIEPGWQDRAVISESGLCIWNATNGKPELTQKNSAEFLNGKLALHWSGKPHNTNDLIGVSRDYANIASLSKTLVTHMQYTPEYIAHMMLESYKLQLIEHMEPYHR